MKKNEKTEVEKEVEQELIPFDPTQIVEFNPLNAQLAEIRELNAKAVFNYADPKGNKEARSHVNTIRLTKGVVERTRVAAKEKALLFGRAVDAKAKEIVAELDAMIEVHAKPLQEIAEREQKRIEAHERDIESLGRYAKFPHDTTAEAWAKELEIVQAFPIDEKLEEFQNAADIAKGRAITDITARLTARQKYEAEQQELQDLREQAERQRQIDRDRKIAEEAAAEATRKAEEKAAREKAEREQAERDRIAAEEKREADRIAAEEKREAERKAAEEKRIAAEKEERERLQREKEEAEARALAAEEKAAADLKAQQEAEAEEARKREANKKHKVKINTEAAKALIQSGAGLSMSTAASIVDAIAAGQIPHVKIEY